MTSHTFTVTVNTANPPTPEMLDYLADRLEDACYTATDRVLSDLLSVNIRAN